MSIEQKTQLGSIHISLEAIATVVATAALECYGVVGLAKKNSVLDEMAKLLNQNDFSKGIFVKKEKQTFSVDLYLIVASGVKITEIVTEVQKKVRYDLEKTFQMKFSLINVFVQSIHTR